jgi:hypothetical protein
VCQVAKTVMLSPVSEPKELAAPLDTDADGGGDGTEAGGGKEQERAEAGGSSSQSGDESEEESVHSDDGYGMGIILEPEVWEAKCHETGVLLRQFQWRVLTLPPPPSPLRPTLISAVLGLRCLLRGSAGAHFVRAGAVATGGVSASTATSSRPTYASTRLTCSTRRSPGSPRCAGAARLSLCLSLSLSVSVSLSLCLSLSLHGATL